MTNYIVYTEIITDTATQRWYYGTYAQERANEVALMLGNEYPTYHCVCRADEAEALGVLNLPR